ncbi:hypothetical protein [Peribacillus frigoritolerans]|uniref:Major virion structural protein n=1 Tax=Peribacillus castrilensis TaxID=2897690 RepID=A0AAW9NNZ1_9BACI|nr:hypothetical protein [Peribacillus castrilensis]
MPYVDTTPASFDTKLTEDNFQQKFADLLTKYGWTGGTSSTSVAKKFKRVVTLYGALTEDNRRPTTIANHYIFKNAKGKMFGMAILSDSTPLDSEIPVDNAALTTWANTEFEKNKVRTTVYYYMLEKLPSFAESSVTKLQWGSNRTQMALDIEVISTKIETSVGTGGSSTSSAVVNQADPLVMQSPIVKSDIRATFLEDINYPKQYTNWWADSEIRVQGQIDANNVFVILQADNVPAWENNIVPTVPFYFGEIDPIDPGDAAVAMFAGTVPSGDDETEVGGYDFGDPNSTAGARILPILKNYPNHPSNGIDSVMLSRAKFGARYQEYFLSWNTAPDAMPPDRENATGKQYPRAWNNIYNNEFKYQFNPSRYSGKVHTSKIYVVHPEEGVRGSLSKAIGLSALNFNAGKLRIRKQNCPTKIYDVYRFHMVGAVSPLTKRPATVYRPIGLGIYDSEYTPS